MLDQFFPGMISASQSAFVKGRSIADNTLLAQEIVRGYSRKNLSPRCAIKVDLQKALDSISWEFLLNVLGAMGLPDRFCGWIKACVTTSRYSIALNGSLVGYFRGARGVEYSDSIQDVKGSFLHISAFLMTCYSFVMDLWIQVDLESNRFYIWSTPCKVFGVPLVTRKLSGTDCKALLERIKDKLRHLILPKGVIQDIERLCMRFFWKGNDSSALGARFSWNKTYCLMLVKNILAGEGSLWIVWIKAYSFKLEDYWSVESKPHFSWTLRKLINMREEAKSLFTASVNWSQARGGWIWDNIRDRNEKVEWHRLIWFPAHIPKFFLITWMVILDRLPTKERLVQFAMVTDARCGFCGAKLESRNHLFSECSYSREVWDAILQSCGL
ncbi:uncharacterized protein LOC120212415 [Hibiscus syriacus]|uniref:uncharacterized protein LOC120212415 n=1 Tax=Hibiscus syriacus TaxID=106335 RepID=UPI0019217294|nr:uncharacterized protein LOC120212415 [Hibiscus syriacus]